MPGAELDEGEPEMAMEPQVEPERTGDSLHPEDSLGTEAMEEDEGASDSPFPVQKIDFEDPGEGAEADPPDVCAEEASGDASADAIIKAAMEEEIKGKLLNGAWKVVPRPANARVHKSRWVFAVR